MKFLVDVCIGGKIAKWLENLGYIIVEVLTKNPNMDDNDIIDWAFQERRIILTADKDFGELAILRGKKHYDYKVRSESLAPTGLGRFGVMTMAKRLSPKPYEALRSTLHLALDSAVKHYHVPSLGQTQRT